MTVVHGAGAASRFGARPTIGRDALAALVGQAANSLTNLALSVTLAATMTIEEFGRFSAVFAVVLLTQGVARVVLAEPLVERLSPGRFVAFPIASVLVLAAGGLAAVGAAADVVGLAAGLSVPVAVGAAAAAVHEPARTALNLQGRTAAAAAADVAWLLFGAVNAAVLVGFGVDVVAALVLAWAGGALASAIASTTAVGAAVAAAGGRRARPTSGSLVYLTEFLIGPGFYHVLPAVLLAALGPVAAGQLRILQLLQAPVLLAVNSLRAPIGGRLARLGAQGRLADVDAEVRRLLRGVVVVSLLWSAAASGVVRLGGVEVTGAELAAAGLTVAAFGVVAVVAADRRWRGDPRLAMAIRSAQSFSFLVVLALSGSLGVSLAGFGIVGIVLGFSFRNRHVRNRHGGNTHAVRQL